MKNPVFTGAGVALITPMNDDFSINYECLDRLVDFQIENGTDAIIACGTTGESATLSHEEHVAVIDRVIKRTAGRVPVIAGTGSNDTAYAVALSQEAERLGADGLLLVTPYYNKASQAGLIKHYSMVADSVKLPVILYNVPSRTGTNILPSTCKALSAKENIVAVKEASENLVQVSQIASLCGDELGIYSGCDDLVVPIMSVGALGVISVLSNIMPKLAHDIPALYLEGKTDESRKLQLEYLDLCKDLFCDVNPIPVKAALNMMGFNVGPCRMPLCEMNEEATAKLSATLARHGLI